MRVIAAVVAGALLLAACGGSSDDDPSPSPVATTTAAAKDQAADQAEQQQAAQDELAEAVAGTVVDIVVADGQVNPQGGRVEVKAGETITLQISSDADEEIHVHSSPEHTYEVEAGGSITESFRIDTPGQVAVEAHELGVTIVQLVVRP